METTNNWLRLDNASNIFLAARNNIDTKVFRLTVELIDEVNPIILQQALTQIYEEFPLFHSVLRRGIFWYYLEKSDVNPRVSEETEIPVQPLYIPNEKNFMFRVLYKENRIHLEVFHALTDGTGAMWFFEDLITEYIRLLYQEEGEGIYSISTREKEDLEDSFKSYFREKKERIKFGRLTDPFKKMITLGTKTSKLFVSPFEHPTSKKTYQIKGETTPDNRPRILNVHLPVKNALALAREMEVSLTIYMTAVFVLAAYEAKENKDKDTTISVSIPINLRQLFPSMTVRNFFGTTTVEYTFKAGEKYELYDICQQLNEQFKPQLEKEALEERLRKYVEFEFIPLARIVLRPIKDLVLKGINKWNNRSITLAMSNLGRFNLPEELEKHIENVYFFTSVVRPQFCMISYGDQLNITFTSPFIETDIFREFVRFLTGQDIEVTIDVNKVTKEELEAHEIL